MSEHDQIRFSIFSRQNNTFINPEEPQINDFNMLPEKHSKVN